MSSVITALEDIYHADLRVLISRFSPWNSALGVHTVIGSSSPLTFDWDEVGGLDYDELGDNVFAVRISTQPIMAHVRFTSYTR